MADKPIYDHDCNHDVYLGTFEEAGKPPVDLHICTKAMLGMSLIARYSSDGPDYESIPVVLFERDMERYAHCFSEPIKEAYRRSEHVRESHD